MEEATGAISDMEEEIRPRVLAYRGPNALMIRTRDPDGNLIITPVPVPLGYRVLLERYNAYSTKPTPPPSGRHWRILSAGSLAKQAPPPIKPRRRKRVDKSLTVVVSGAPARDEAGAAIGHPRNHIDKSLEAVSVKIPGKLLVMYLRSFLAFGASIVKGVVSPGTKAESESSV